MLRDSQCTSCPLVSRKGVIQVGDNKTYDYVFIIDGPSSSDVFEGKVLTGQQGLLFDRVISYFNTSRESIYVAYACSCRLPSELYKKGYQKAEISKCRNKLIQEVKSKKPKFVILAGEVAIQSVLNRKDTVSSLRGTRIWSHELDAEIVVTYNPESLLRSPKSFSDFTNDIGAVLTGEQLNSTTLKEKLKTKCSIARTVDQTKQALQHILKLPNNYNDCVLLSCDIETRGVNFRKHAIYCIAFSWKEGEAVVITDQFLTDEIVHSLLTQLMTSTRHRFIWQNGKFDIKFFRYILGINAKVDEDTMLKHYSFDERKGTHGLENLAQVFLNAEDFKSQFWKKWKSKIENLPAEALKELYEYCASDTDYTRRIFLAMDEQFQKDGAKKAYHHLLIPGSNAFADIEYYGFFIDKDNIEAAEMKYEAICNKLNEVIVSTALEAGWNAETYAAMSGAKKIPEYFNPNSTKQLAHVLYDVLKMPLYKGTRTTNEGALVMLQKRLDKPVKKYFEELYKPSDDASEEEKQEMQLKSEQEYLKAMQEWLDKGHAQRFIHALLDYREKFKLFSTYVIGLKNAVHEDDGRIHATFLLHGTETGRLASNEPNMQNIPRSKEIRNFFTVPKNRVILAADYSQCELRTLAVLSQDPFLMKTYYDGLDLHDAVAEKLFGKGFTKEQRVRAKAVNFGLAYGRTEYTIAEEYGIPVKEARQVIEDWFFNIPIAGKYILDRRQDPKRTGETITTIFGRKRRFPLITPEKAWSIENESINFAVSSPAADLTLKSTIIANDVFKRFNVKSYIINEVHDSIMSEADADKQNVDLAAYIKVSIMQKVPLHAMNTDMPFLADLEIGTHWGNLKKYTASPPANMPEGLDAYIDYMVKS